MRTKWGDRRLLERVRAASTIVARRAFATSYRDLLCAEDALDIAKRVRSEDTELSLRAIQIARRLPVGKLPGPNTLRAEGDLLAWREDFAAAVRRWKRTTGTEMQMVQGLSASGCFDEVEALLEAIRQNPAQAAHPRFVIMEAVIQFERGAFDASLASLRKALEHSWPPQAEISIRINRASILSTAGRYDDARDEARRAMALAQPLGGKQLYAAQHLRARIDLKSGLYGRALPQFEALLPHIERDAPARHADCSLAIAQLFLQINMPARALSLADSAVQRFEALTRPLSAAYARFFFGTALRELGKLDAARLAIEHARNAYQRVGHQHWIAICDLRLAEIERDMHQTERAYERALGASARFSEFGMDERHGQAERLLAEIEHQRGGVAAATARLERALTATDEASLPWLHCSLHHRLAQWNRSNPQRALTHALRAANLVEIHRHVVPPDECMAAFLEEKAHVFMEAVRNTLAVGGPDTERRVFDLVERSRSRALLDRLADTTAEGPAETQQRQVEAMRARLPEGSRREHPALGRGVRAAIEVQEQAIRAQAHRDAASHEDATSLEAVRAALGPHDVMYEWFRLNDSLLRIRVTQQELDIHVHDFSSQDLDVLLGRLSFHMGRVTMLPSGFPAAMAERLTQDAEAALTDVADRLFDGEPDPAQWKRIYVVPSGALHDVPFGALMIDGQPLIASATLTCNPSASVHQRCLARTTRASGVPLLVAVADDDAREITDEVQALHTMFPEANVLTGKAATVAAVTEALADASWVHIAAHARYLADDPFDSGVALADDWLTLRAMNELVLQPDLVTLSGCATGRVTVSDSEEVFGLARGILAAGARNLLATLWPVGDASTRAFMAHFYATYRDTGDAAHAHQVATLATRASHPHPFFWAPFALIGAGSGHPPQHAGLSGVKIP